MAIKHRALAFYIHSQYSLIY